MKRSFVYWCAVAGFLIAIGMGGPLAQVDVEPAQGVSAEGVPHVSGGIGTHEREELEAAAGDYNLKLVFAESTGAFVASVQVSIKDSTGSTVLDALSNGPLFFARLPAGTYAVEATYEGIAKQSTVAVPPSGQRALDFRW